MTNFDEFIDSFLKAMSKEFLIPYKILKFCQHCDNTGEIPIPDHGLAACLFCHDGEKS